MTGKTPFKSSRYISNSVIEFLNDYVKYSLQRSEHTIRGYRDAISLYLTYLEEEKGIDERSLSLDCFDSDVINDWLDWLAKDRGNTPQTINSRLAAIRKFLSFLKIKDRTLGYLLADAKDIERRPAPKVKVQGMPIKAIETLLEMPNTRKKTGRRDLALYTLMYTTAARVDEVLSLKIKDLFLDKKDPYITICHGKGDKVRSVPLTRKAVAHLKKYIKEFHRPEPDPESFVFYSRNGGPLVKMTAQNVLDRLKAYAERAHEKNPEVPENTHCHTLRHARASHWLEKGMNIVQISKLLGHESLGTTQKYLDLSDEETEKYLAVTEEENSSNVRKDWKRSKDGLAGFCGVKKAVTNKNRNL